MRAGATRTGAEAVAGLAGVSRDFFDGKTTRTVLADVDLDVRPGELTIIAGPSGSGKTTLLTILGLVLTPSRGRVFVEGKDVTRLSDNRLAGLRLRKFGFVFQQAALLPALSALDNILVAHAVQGRRVRRSVRDKARGLLESFGLGRMGHVKPQRLSGGEKQRVAVARAMINDPVLLLCDEPTASLDVESSRIVLESLQGIASDGRAVVLISHDSRVFPYGDRLVKLENGRIVYDSSTSAAEEPTA